MRTATIVAAVLASCLAAGCNQRGKKAMAEPSSAGAEATPVVPAAGQDRHDANTPSGISPIGNEAMPERVAGPDQRDADTTVQVSPAGARAMLTARPAGPDLPLASNAVEPALTGGESALIRKAETRGRAIYLHDDYAARATDLVEARGVDLWKIGSRGWITEGRPGGCTVTFVAGGPPPWRSVCVVTFTANEEPNIVLTNGDLTETQSARFRARQFAIESIEHPHPGPYNTVVIPHDDAPGWLAYALAATTDSGIIVVGGHYRATVSADGLTLLEHRGFTKSHLDLPKRPKDMPPDCELAAYGVSHLLDNTPTEIHVFLSLQCRKLFYVTTPDQRLWCIANGKILLVKRP